MNKKIYQKMSKNKYHIVNPKITENKYLKPISSREKKFIKERSQLESIFQIYLLLLTRIINGSIIIKDSLYYIFNIKPSNFSNLFSSVIGGICSYNNIGDVNERLNSDNRINKLKNGKYVLRDKTYMEKNYYYLFVEQLGSIINMSKTTDYYNYFKTKSEELSGKYGISIWIIFCSMIGLANIWYAIEASNQEIKNLFISGTDIVNEPYLIIS